MTTAPRVRPSTETDAPQLVAMMRLFHAGERARLGREHLAVALATLAAEPRLGRLLVVDAGQDPLGYALVTFGFDIARGGHTATVTELYVRSVARRRGLGTLLLAAVERVALEAGARHIQLSVAPENEGAFALCRSRGFEPSPRIPLTKDLAAESADHAR